MGDIVTLFAGRDRTLTSLTVAIFLLLTAMAGLASPSVAVAAGIGEPPCRDHPHQHAAATTPHSKHDGLANRRYPVALPMSVPLP